MKRIVRRFWPLLASAGTIIAIWQLWFEPRNVTPQGDPWVALVMAGSYLVAIVFLLIYTTNWALRSLGQLFTYLADACFYGSTGIASYGWSNPFTASTLNLFRSMFLFASISLVLGLVWWAISTRSGRRAYWPVDRPAEPAEGLP